jgi:uncharacterized membrane protein
MLEGFLTYSSVFLLGGFELWIAIPAGLALGLPPIMAGVLSFAGAITGLLIILLAGGKLRRWLLKKHQKPNGKAKPNRIKRIWDRYGVIGLGLLAPITTGVPLGAAIGLAFGASSGRMLLWMSLGAAIWSTIIAWGAAFGIMGLSELWGLITG